MIPGIQEYTRINGQLQDGFPSYATLSQAVLSFENMGERTISTRIKIDGDVTPDFSGWELVFKGERFVLPVREPQASKDNTTRNSLVDLTFYSWPTLQMKRYFFFNLPSVTAGVAIPDQYIASVNLPITGFVQLFNGVLQYYFGSSIRMELFDQEYDTNPVAIEINYSHIWDVLTKFYDLFGYRWNIVEENGAYVIKVNFPADAINDHDFEYGYQGGLLKFERQVQDDSINNVLLGRGGEKNLPYRYFKRYTGSAERPDTFPDDPDALYELKDIYFDRLRDTNFRWYVRGWMQNSNRDRTWENAGYIYPQYDESECPSASLFAFRKGKTDASFRPVEYAKDDDSIEKYGERWGAVENQDEIYPTIQGLSREGVGRIDETVAVSEILTDDIDAAAHNAVTENIIEGRRDMYYGIHANSTKSTTFIGEPFEIPTGKTGNLALTTGDSGDPYFVTCRGYDDDTEYNLRVSGYTLMAKNEETGEIVSGSGIPAGTYRYVAEITVENSNDWFVWITCGFNGIKLVIADEDANAWKPTFDIWVKNIWNTQRAQGESDQAYSERVWLPILGDRVGNEAKLVFSTGPMSISQDYEFQLAAYPVPDQSMSINGVPSEWKITLRKSDAEFDATGLFIPNAKTGGQPQAGDKFFFTGIDMPNMYVTEAEKRLNVNKESQLDKTSGVNPTWAITLDKVRVHTLEDGEYGQTLAERLSAGCTVRTTDPRFTPGEVLVLYVQSLTYSWNEGDQVPNIEVVLSDKIIPTVNPIQKLSGDVSFIRESYVQSSELEAAIRRVASPMFLKKTGEEDSSNSPTSFASALSSKNFRQGDIAGAGWGHYEDGNGDSVLELDKLVVRKEMRVNSLIANQIAYVGGKQVISAASIECKQVIEDENSYTCYFDQRQGTVANLFVVGDIVLGQTFDPENVETRYYRCQVSDVGLDHIVLSKSGKDGDGAPEKGDTIVQYGHVSDVNRQFVIVRDVIGGGYERMISGLNSTLADGNEYHYAGHAAGAGPRWFVGSRTGEYAEWINGRLNIKGTLVVRNSDGSYQAMTDYMAAVNTAMGELQAQIDGQIQSWSGAVAPMPEKDGQGQVDPSTANYPANQWTTDAERLKHFGDIYVDDTTGQGWRYTRLPNEGAFYWMRITDAELAQALSDILALQEDVAGLNYLKVATNNGTLVQGGLVLTSMMQLGQVENGVYKVYSGINGVLDQTMQDPTRSIAAWFGGPMVDHEAQPSEESYARTLFRHDGSGYLASGRIHWNPTGAGGIPGISWSGNQVVIDGDVKLSSVSGDSVTSMLTLLRQINDWFGEDANGDIYVKKTASNAPRNFYSYGAVTAGGLNPGGGGGSTIDLPRMWQALMNTNAPVADDPNNKIAVAHIPTLSIAQTTGLQSALDAKQNTITDLSTIRSRADEGHTAYGYFSSGILGTSHVPDLAMSKITGLQTALDGKQPAYGFTINGTSGATYNLANFVTSSGVTSITAGTGLSGGTITSSGTIGIASGYKLPTTTEWAAKADASALAGYLPLSGGTVTGQLILQSGRDTKLILNNTDGEQWSAISFRENGEQYASITAKGNYFELSTPGSLYVNGYPVITSANIGSQSVSYATTAGSAPASDVYSWAKQPTKPSYHAGELDITPRNYKVSYVAAGIAPYISEIGTNIFSGATTSEITVERSTDDGSTWVDVTAAEAANVKNVFSGCVYDGALAVSARSHGEVGDKLRITFNPSGSSRYCQLAFIYIYYSTNGAGTTCLVEKNTYTNQNVWTTYVADAPISGWPGPNVIGMGGTIFGQGDSRDSGYGLRFTFRINSVRADYDSRGTIYTIQGFTSNRAWGRPSGNSIARSNVPYSFTNADRAVSFDNTVAASGFIRANSNDSYVLLGGGGHAALNTLSVNYASSAGSASSATALATSRTIWGQSFDGSANVSGAMTGVDSINGLVTFGANNRLVEIGATVSINGLLSANSLSSSGNMDVGGNITASGNNAQHSFGGTTTIKDLNVTVTAYFGKSNSPVDVYVRGPLTVGSSSANRPTKLYGTLNATGNTTIGGTLSVTGTVKTGSKYYFGDTGAYLEYVNIGTAAEPVYAIHSNVGIYSDSFVSAGGLNSQGGGSAGVGLGDVWNSLTNTVADQWANTQINLSHIPVIPMAKLSSDVQDAISDAGRKWWPQPSGVVYASEQSSLNITFSHMASNEYRVIRHCVINSDFDLTIDCDGFGPNKSYVIFLEYDFAGNSTVTFDDTYTVAWRNDDKPDFSQIESDYSGRPIVVVIRLEGASYHSGAWGGEVLGSYEVYVQQ